MKMSVRKSSKAVKNYLQKDKGAKRISRKQYNKELAEAVVRMEEGTSVSHKDALKELVKW